MESMHTKRQTKTYFTCQTFPPKQATKRKKHELLEKKEGNEKKPLVKSTN